MKKLKNLFPVLFLTKTGLDGPRKREKILVPNSVHTGLGQENSEKNRKKNQKIKKPLFGIILVPNSVHNRPGEENSKKNSKKIQKTKKPLSGLIFSQNGMR